MVSVRILPGIIFLEYREEARNSYSLKVQRRHRLSVELPKKVSDSRVGSTSLRVTAIGNRYQLHAYFKRNYLCGAPPHLGISH